jgi:S-(hydroxymethyl)glutathione dehydrogenase/alcohol dehydrogenase
LDLVKISRPSLVSGQVLVALDFSGVCRSQLMEVRGLRGPDRLLPHLLGHEGVGTVVDIGPDVTKVKIGARVIVGWIKGEGIEAEPPILATVHGERINAGRVTTFSEYSVVSENRVYLQPAELDHRSAVLFGCALLTGAGMVLNEARPEAGESVLINGLGGIGLAALIATQGLGVTVIAADPDPGKRELALGLGAAYAVDPFARALPEQVREHFPAGVDAAVDAAGTTAGIEAAFNSTRYDGGRLVFASHPPAGERISLDPHDLIKGRTIRGSWGGACRPDEDIPRMAKAIAASGTSLDFMMPRTYSLEDVNLALDDLEAQRAMRPVISLKPHEFRAATRSEFEI